ncbi:MAG: hypothetical protein HYV07_15545 [Deltaproteobacteria bacterium]|nr:hypothetical protein [Deltaproteobacteria bacterium]
MGQGPQTPAFVGPTNVEAIYESRDALGATWKGLMKGGLFVPVDPPRAIGTMVAVRIKAPDADIELEGRVIHQVDAKLSKSYGQPIGVGIEFRAVRKELLADVELYLAGKKKKVGFGAGDEKEDDGLDPDLDFDLDALDDDEDDEPPPPKPLEKKVGSQKPEKESSKKPEKESSKKPEKKLSKAAAKIAAKKSGEKPGSKLKKPVMEEMDLDDEGIEVDDDDDGIEIGSDDDDEVVVEADPTEEELRVLAEAAELTKRAEGDLYALLGASPTDAFVELEKKLIPLMQKLMVKGELTSSGRSKLDAARMGIRAKVKEIETEKARLIHDFKTGHARAEERVAAVKFSQPALKEMLAVWFEVFPKKESEFADKMKRAQELAEQKDFRAAFKAGREAVELAPFSFEVRAKLAEWKRAVQQPRSESIPGAHPPAPQAFLRNAWGMLKSPESAADIVAKGEIEARAELTPIQVLLSAVRAPIECTVLIGSFVFEISGNNSIARFIPPDREGALHELVRTGILPASDLDSLLDEAGDDPSRAESLAISSNKIDEDQLASGLRAVIARRAPDFVDERGAWRTADHLRGPAVVKINFDQISRAVFTSSLALLPSGSSETYFQSLMDQCPTVTSGASTRLAQMKLDPRELELATSMHGQETLREVVKRSTIARNHFFALLLWLVSSGLCLVGEKRKASAMDQILAHVRK